MPKLKKLSPFIFIFIAFIAVYGPTLKWLFERWMMGVWYNAHGVIVPFASGYLIWSRLRASPDSFKTKKYNCIGFFLLVGALLLHIVDTVIWSQILSAISIIPAVIGLSLLFLGVSATRSIWLPLLLLLFMIPIPSAAVQPLVVLMRSITAIGASFVLELIGIPLIRTGTYIEIPNAVINVANACSGLATFSATLAFTAFLLWFCPLNLRAMVILLATVFPVALGANIVRNIFLIVLSFHNGVQILDTFWHPLSGYSMYIIAICIQGLIYNLIKKGTAAKCSLAARAG